MDVRLVRVAFRPARVPVADARCGPRAESEHRREDPQPLQRRRLTGAGRRDPCHTNEVPSSTAAIGCWASDIRKKPPIRRAWQRSRRCGSSPYAATWSGLSRIPRARTPIASETSFRCRSRISIEPSATRASLESGGWVIEKTAPSGSARTASPHPGGGHVVGRCQRAAAQLGGLRGRIVSRARSRRLSAGGYRRWRSSSRPRPAAPAAAARRRRTQGAARG